MLSMIDRHERSTGDWNTMPISRRAPRTGEPPTVILPALGLIRPAIIISSVLLPQPEGSSTLTNSPGVSAKLASWIASVSP